ncbi:MAG: class I SAM-dependent methyltransferase [Deltaproteobacteria bacterium]|nr:class I SAM-dependent methyltransferase [Deltaproteobacteria bacterium]
MGRTDNIKASYRRWMESYRCRKQYSTMERVPFYEVAGRFLPSHGTATIVDIGSGDGLFVRHLKLDDRYERVFLLDSNPEAVKHLSSLYANVVAYTAPERLPFEDEAVDYIHCSHMMEHLDPLELYTFVKEIDRVLSPGGSLVISTPLLWTRFYDDLSHVKPYNPDVFSHYLCKSVAPRSRQVISDRYALAEIVYRYSMPDLTEGWGSDRMFVDFPMQAWKFFLLKLGIKKAVKNGYTMVLKKM